jgi:mRNA interferase RelE/StbE
MSLYSLKFTKLSYKEWSRLDSTIKVQFQKKLKKILQNPRIDANKLSGYENIYKIKLRSSGYRLAYEVKEKEIVVIVLKIGKRDKFYNLFQNTIQTKAE